MGCRDLRGMQVLVGPASWLSEDDLRECLCFEELVPVHAQTTLAH